MDVRQTKDGSKTLHRPDLSVHYHSVHGAWSETRHVFGEMGVQPALERKEEGSVRILEVGFGTGLNALDVWLRGKEAARKMELDSLEPFPLAWKDLSELEYHELTGVPLTVWQGMHAAGQWEDEQLLFKRIDAGLFEANLPERHYDVVLFDAFAPAAQPELWRIEAFDRIRFALKPGGQLVTYCAKGQVRRSMEASGFQVDRLPGPPGKREMLRATRPLNPAGRFNVRVYMLLLRQVGQTRQVLVSYERLPMGGVMKFPGGGLEWGEGTAACLRREALEELGQPIHVRALVHVSQQTHISSFDDNHQVLAVHYESELAGEVDFEDDGCMEDVFGKKVALMHQSLGWRDVEGLDPSEFRFASDREAWQAWLDQNS